MSQQWYSTLLLLGCMIANIRADFFAYRKLISSRSKNIVYLLYDMHASTVSASAEERAQVYAVVDAKISEFLEGMRGKNYVQILPLQENLFQEMDIQLEKLRSYMPNLVKQQRDLVDVVRAHGISLICEDWRKDKLRFTFTQFEPARKSPNYFHRVAGKPKTFESKLLYQEGVSPLLELSAAVTGATNAAAGIFIPVGTAYVYNPDLRSWGSISKEAIKQVDERTIDAMYRLFYQYGQKAIIVAEGCVHIAAVAQVLIARGYSAGPLKVSANLQSWRGKDTSVDSFLSALERGDDLKSYENVVYPLIADPLDIAALFAEELGGQRSAEQELRSWYADMVLLQLAL